jgi:glycosyl transferase, family 25
MPSSILPVFAISLPRFKTRHAYIKSHLAARFGTGYEIVGVDGAEVDEDSVAERGLTKGQIGCALSHLAVYRLMAERNIPHAFVVEDDVVLPRDIQEVLETLRPSFSDSGVVQLYNWGGGAEYSNHMSIKVLGGMSLHHPMRASDLGGTLAYVIGSRAAEGILAANYPVRVTADNWEFFFEHGALETARVLHPSPISVKPFETTVLPKTYAESSLGGAAILAARVLLAPLLTVRRKIAIKNRHRAIKLCDGPSEIVISQSRN